MHVHVPRGPRGLQKVLLGGVCVMQLLSAAFVGLHLNGGSRPSFYSADIPTVWIVSHRRSGTHLTMDLLARIIQPPFRLVKTNHVYLTNLTEAQGVKDGLNCKCLAYLKRTGKIIHAHRDVRDVVTSTYYYYTKFNPRFMKGVNRTSFFKNKGKIRDKIIGTWVNTTVPWFAQPDILQLYFTDTASGLEHVYDRIASFLGKDRQEGNPVGDVRKMKSVSSAVWRHSGKGDHGYKLELTAGIQDEIMRKARELHQVARRDMLKCPKQGGWFRRVWDTISDSMTEGYWVGGKKEYGLYAPSYCPPIMKSSTVYMDLGNGQTQDVEGKGDQSA